MSKKINIAIDGYSSCGKSTLAKALAQILQYIYIDSGAMYRAITLFAIQNNLVNDAEAILKFLPEIDIHFSFNPKTGTSETYLNGNNVESEIRTIAVSQKVSYISKLKEVRQKLVHLQRKMSENKGVVMDGRDIGSVVLPNAELKIFMTADDDVRAQRRFDELKAKGENHTYSEVMDNLKLRDYNDINRKESPLLQVDDARVLDNSKLTKEEQFDLVLNWVDELVLVS